MLMTPMLVPPVSVMIVSIIIVRLGIDWPSISGILPINGPAVTIARLDFTTRSPQQECGACQHQ
jgi:hypothetical protein